MKQRRPRRSTLHGLLSTVWSGFRPEVQQFVASIYGLVYGFLLAATYALLRWTGNGGLLTFALASGILAAIHLLLFPRDTLAGILQPKNILRGALFGSAQVCLFRAQMEAPTSTMLMLSALGSLVGMACGRFFLGERPTRQVLIAAVLALSGVAFNSHMLVVSVWGLLGGALQGVTATVVRSLAIDGRKIRESVASGFVLGAIIAALVLVIGQGLPSPRTTTAFSLVTATLSLVAVQYAYFLLNRLLDSQRGSILALSRIPWAVGIELFGFQRTVTGGELVASLLIVIGNAFALAFRAPSPDRDRALVSPQGSKAAPDVG